MIVTASPSPNFGPRKNNAKIKYLILHYTGMEDPFDALRRMQDPAAEVSAHYMVDESGMIYQLVDEDMRAWHAGKSWWEGEDDVNSTSIGIEIQNPGHEFGYRPFPDVQIAAVNELCRDIVARRKILPAHVIGHSDIAPARKQDPGELFPWTALAAAGVGLKPVVTDLDELEADKIISEPEAVKSLLTRFGYDPRLDLEVLVTAFQRHFEPDVFDDAEKIGKYSLNTVQLLVSLYRQKLAQRVKL